MALLNEDGIYRDVIIIGAGISGINFAYRLQERNPELSYSILEGRHELGGTWSLFRYPGVRSDTSLYTYGFACRLWKDHTSIAQGSLITKYLDDSMRETHIDKQVIYNRHVTAASWSSLRKIWTLSVTANNSEQETYRCRFLMLCTGYYDYDEGLKTSIPGIKNFRGRVIHPQFWPADLDYFDKDIVIIGSGATAITLLPALTDKASHVTMLQRSPTYVLSVPQEDGIEKLIRKFFNRTTQEVLLWYKWLLVPFFLVNLFYYFPSLARNIVRKATMAQLPSDLAFDPHFKPRYEVGEQRLCFCPEGDFYKALQGSKASIETGIIESVTSNSIKLESGQELYPDIIVTATGLKLRIGGGVRITVDGIPYRVSDKFVWKGAMLEDLPNCGFVIGYADAAWTLGADASAQLITRILTQMRCEGVVEVRPYRSDIEKQNVQERPLLRLTSTYISKGASNLPRAGDQGQWAVRTSYVKDILMAWYGDIKSSMAWVEDVKIE